MKQNNKQDKPKTVTRIDYEVTFGPKKESDREKQTFDNEDDAVRLFKEKEKAGMHVDAYEITQTLTLEKKKLSA